MDFVPGTALLPPSDERIRWFENAYRITLLSEHVAVLKSGNGGVPVQNVFFQNNRERMIERMLCLLDAPKEDSDHGWYDLSVVITQLDARLIDDEDLVGMNVIPIAALFGGDFVCLDYRKNPSSPVVAVWDHELSDEFEPHLETVANSFGEFNSMLKQSGN